MHVRCIDVGITVYQPPDLGSLSQLLSIGGRRIWLFLNSPLTATEKESLAGDRVHFLNDGNNLGVGAAYNRIMSAASQGGADMVLLLDQDSVPEPSIVERLSISYQLLKDFGENPALVAATARSPDQAFKPPKRFRNFRVKERGSLRPVEFAISSGSLIDITVWKMVDPFRDDFFIDAIDIEWCFRAQSVGFTCWIDSDIEMVHHLGQGVIRVPIVNWLLTRQPPQRLYTYVRNQTAMLSLRHVPLRWRSRILPYLFVQGLVYLVVSRGRRKSVMRAFCFGIMDGLRGRLGVGRGDLC